ncbi:DNA polymerase III epsilon subunit [Vibrio maritimus]|uniref:DNA polymerase III epsilon subunit n=1 Tax=Vibrio maritimus TaxID=990268 RepID=A0A090S653_9VIBR|nr:DNA polymerase III epsilon subunit [Vibrio maritimus]
MTIIVSGIDVETTGFDAEKGHRITEVALIVYKLHTKDMRLEEVTRIATLVNPKRDIPAEVQAITGITPALVKDKITWDELAPKVSKVMMKTDIFIAHNAEFDSLFVAHELLRLGLPINEDMEVFCTMENGRFATPLGKPPRLQELCWALGVDFDSEAAHRAIYDTEKMMDAVRVGIEKGYFDLSEVVELIEAERTEAA